MDKQAQDYDGVFIVIEGSDGSGKTAQFKLLAERLKAVGYDVAVFDFPRYDHPSSYFVKQYLNGHYGPAGQVSPYSASLFYALDRFEAAPEIRRALEAGKVVLSNRYVGSNMAHQGSKFTNQAEQRGFFVWADSLEFNLLGIPRPNINIFLRVPPEIAYQLVAKKAPRAYTQQTHDVHEADINHLRRASETYDLLHKLFPKDFIAIDCTQNGELLSIPAISDKIWQTIGSFLPAKKARRAQGITFRLNSGEESAPQKKLESSAEDRPESHQADVATKPVASVAKLSLLVASMAESELLMPIKVNSSWRGNRPTYQTYALSGLPKELARQYKQTMSRLRDLNRQMTKELRIMSEKVNSDKALRVQSNSALEAAIPMTALVDVEITLESQAIQTLMSKLNISGMAEAKWLSSQIKNRVGQIKSTSHASQSELNKSTQPEHLRQTLSKLAKTRLLQSMAAEAEAVQLSSYWPRNEFNILVDGIYPYSSLSRQEIEGELDHFSFDQKTSLMKSIVAQADNPVLSQIHYLWDVLCDWTVLRRLIASGLADDLQIQPASPRYGYEVPKIIEQAHQEDAFMECFDLSLELFSAFQSAGREDLAPYALLQGHRLRCQFKTTAAKLVEKTAKSTFQPDSYSQLLEGLSVQVRLVHPIIGAGLLPKDSSEFPPAKASDKTSRKSRSKSKSA